jgi:hypothetical protein
MRNINAINAIIALAGTLTLTEIGHKDMSYRVRDTIMTLLAGIVEGDVSLAVDVIELVDKYDTGIMVRVVELYRESVIAARVMMVGIGRNPDLLSRLSASVRKSVITNIYKVDANYNADADILEKEYETNRLIVNRLLEGLKLIHKAQYKQELELNVDDFVIGDKFSNTIVAAHLLISVVQESGVGRCARWLLEAKKLPKDVESFDPFTIMKHVDNRALSSRDILLLITSIVGVEDLLEATIKIINLGKGN